MIRLLKTGGGLVVIVSVAVVDQVAVVLMRTSKGVPWL